MVQAGERTWTRTRTQGIVSTRTLPTIVTKAEEA